MSTPVAFPVWQVTEMLLPPTLPGHRLALGFLTVKAAFHAMGSGAGIARSLVFSSVVEASRAANTIT